MANWDLLNMSLDDYIKQNMKPGNHGGQNHQSRSRSRGPYREGRSRSQGRSHYRNNYRSRSRSKVRGLTPRGRAGLDEPVQDMPSLFREENYYDDEEISAGFAYRNRSRSRSRSRARTPDTRDRSSSRQRYYRRDRSRSRSHSVVSSLTPRGRAGLEDNDSYTNRFSDVLPFTRKYNSYKMQQILRNQNQHSRSRLSLDTTDSQLVVSVSNNFARSHRENGGSVGYLNRQSLEQLSRQHSAYPRSRSRARSPASVYSQGSGRSRRSDRSNGRYSYHRDNRSNVNGAFKQVLNPDIQREIAAIQGKAYIDM